MTADNSADVPTAPSAPRFALTSDPNPAGERAVFCFALPATGRVTLAVFDVLGRRVATLIDQQQMVAGPHDAIFETETLRAGTYFARLEFGSQRATQKIQVVR